MTAAMLLFSALTGCPATEPAAAPTPVSATVATPETHDHGVGEHSHSSPHGGIVQSGGDMHVEALMMPGGVMFYLSDADQKPLSVDGFTGSAVIKGPSGVTTADLVSMGDHLHAMATLEQGKPASAVLTLTHDGKAVSASFDTEGVGLQSHDHTALHGGQVSMWGDHHLEYAPKDGEYQVWVSDEHRNPVSGPITGAVKDGDSLIPLTQDESGMLSAKGEGAGTRPVTVDIKFGETSFSLGFNAVEAVSGGGASK